jgi:hypothetical protein
MDFLQFQQCKRKHYYGYGSAVYKEEDFEGVGQLCFETQTDRTCTCRLGLTVVYGLSEYNL